MQANKYWPSLEGNNTAFWSHEWGKHGTCSGLDQLTYFRSALQQSAYSIDPFPAPKGLAVICQVTNRFAHWSSSSNSAGAKLDGYAVLINAGFKEGQSYQKVCDVSFFCCL